MWRRVEGRGDGVTPLHATSRPLHAIDATVSENGHRYMPIFHQFPAYEHDTPHTASRNEASRARIALCLYEQQRMTR